MQKNALLLLVSFCANATDANRNHDLFELSLAELASIEIAAKQTQNVYSSPSTVSTISRQQLLNLGVTDLQTLLNFIPGFQSTRDVEQGTANRIAARGRSTALSESVLVQIDGNKVNDLYTGGISIINRLLNLGNVKRVEIIRGPGSALYGGNAFLGVINIITDSTVSGITLSTNNSGLIASQLSYHSTDNSLDLYISAFNNKGDDYQFTDIYGIEDNTRDPIKGHDLYLKYKYNNWQFIGRHMARKLNDFLPLGSFGNDINQEETRQWSLTSSYQHSLTNSSSLKVRAHYSADAWQTIALLIPKDVEIAPDFALENDFIGGPYLTSHSIKVSSELTHRYSNEQNFTVGAVFEQSKTDEVYTSTTHNLTTLTPYNTSIKLDGDESFNVLATREISSLYLQNQILINKQWEITAGLRYDNYNDFGDTLNPRFALIWKPAVNTSLKMLYGSAFRAPNFLELYDKNNYVDFGNVNLDAEEVETYEIGWLNTSDTWHWEVTWFVNKFNRLIELGPAVINEQNPFFAPQFINRDNKDSQGVETELILKISDQVSLHTNYTWFSKNSDISVSRQAGTIILNYQLDELNINFSHYYRGKSALVEEQNGYWVSGFNLRYNYSSAVTFALSGSNIFNTNYKTPSIIYPTGVPNKGRILSASIEYRY